jgi:hypothetical protein
MYEITELRLGENRKTRLWLSAKALGDFKDFRTKGVIEGRFLSKLRWCCNVGFDMCERGSKPIVTCEWDGVYRIGFQFSLVRIIGFYEDRTKKDFIAIHVRLKHGQKLTARDRECINEVGNVRKNRLWRKAADERYPRLAQ